MFSSAKLLFESNKFIFIFYRFTMGDKEMRDFEKNLKRTPSKKNQSEPEKEGNEVNNLVKMSCYIDELFC